MVKQQFHGAMHK